MQSRTMRIRLALLIMLTALLLAACGGNEPLTVGEIQQTREAEFEEAQAEATAEAETINASLIARAPEGTVFAETPPGREHDSNLSIPFGPLPPNGGTHNPSWQRCEVYGDPIKPEHAIHSMEHGAVWIAYQTDLDADSVSQLERVARGERSVLMSPYPELRSPVVLTAWGIQLELDSASDGRVQEFVDAYAGGPQSPEPGANCVSGTQETVEY